MEEALFATGIPFMGRGDEADDAAYAAGMMRVARASSGVRRFGAAALIWPWLRQAAMTVSGARAEYLGYRGRLYSGAGGRRLCL